MLAGAAVGLAGACARQGAPPGGPQDRRPPVVVTTVPDTFAVDSAFGGPVRFDFDERISERPASGTLDGAVIVSPRTGDVRVSHSRAGLKVELAGGFKKGLVYRVTVLPVFKDMFNNQMRDPFELVFSTGAPFVNSALAGMVWDRITGQPMRDMEVRALSEADSASYFAQSDTAGIYALRYLPPARYQLTAFSDRNQNYELDPTEPRGERAVLLNGPDTVLPLDISALQPDTAHARVRDAEALDSLTVVVTFDHYIDPDESPAHISASLSRDSGSAPAPHVTRVYQEHAYSAWVEQVRDSVARLDSLAAAERAKEEAAKRAAAAAAAARPDTSAPEPTPARPRANPANTVRDTGAVVDTTARAAGDTVAGRQRGRPPVPDTAVRDTALHVVPVLDTTVQAAEAPPAAPDTTVRDTALHIVPPVDTTKQEKTYLPPRLQGSGGTGGGRPPGQAGGRPEEGLGPDGKPLPKQRIVLVLDSALTPNVDYVLTVQGVTTVNGIPLGGGEAHFTRQPPQDTTKAVQDTAAVKDTSVVRDTSAVRDTSVVPDSSVVPDTSTVPDTARHLLPTRRGESREALPYPFVALPERRERR